MPDQTPNLTVAQLASQVRTKYPGTYDKVDDDKLVSALTTKYPVYNDYLSPAAGAKPQVSGTATEVSRGPAAPPSMAKFLAADPISQALGTAQSFLKTPVQSHLLGGATATSLMDKVLPAKSTGGAKGSYADAARIGAGFADFASSPEGIANMVLAGATAGASAPYQAALYTAATAQELPSKYSEYKKNPSPENLQNLLLTGGLASGMAAGIGHQAPSFQERIAQTRGAFKTSANEIVDPLQAMYPKDKPVDPGLGPKQATPATVAPQVPMRNLGNSKYVLGPDGWRKQEPVGVSTGQRTPSADPSAGRAAADSSQIPPPIVPAQAGVKVTDVAAGSPGRGVAGGTQIGGEREVKQVATGAPAPLEVPSDVLATLKGFVSDNKLPPNIEGLTETKAPQPQVGKPQIPTVQPPTPKSATEVPVPPAGLIPGTRVTGISKTGEPVEGKFITLTAPDSTGRQFARIRTADGLIEIPADKLNQSTPAGWKAIEGTPPGLMGKTPAENRELVLGELNRQLADHPAKQELLNKLTLHDSWQQLSDKFSDITGRKALPRETIRGFHSKDEDEAHVALTDSSGNLLRPSAIVSTAMHELTHVQQAANFAPDQWRLKYDAQSKRFGYYKNPYEVQARITGLEAAQRAKTEGGLSFLGTKAIADKASTAGHALDKVLYAARQVLAPFTNVPEHMQDVVMKNLIGDPARLAATINNVTKNISDHINKLPRDQQLDMADRYMTGAAPKNDLEVSWFKFLKDFNDQTHKAQLEFRPNLPKVENYFGTAYSGHLLPDGSEDLGFKGFFAKGPPGHSPWDGSKAQFKHKTFEKLSDAVNAGFIPHSYNMVDMFKHTTLDMYKFLTAQRVWKAAKEEGSRVFVKAGDKNPDGFINLDDRIAKVMLSIDEVAGLHSKDEKTGLFTEVGHYAVQEGLGTALNNYFSPDYLRRGIGTTAAGKAIGKLGTGLMDLKNAYTMMELTGPYHLWTTTANSIAAQLSHSFNQFYNVGLRNLSARDIKESFTKTEAPWKMFSSGGKLRAVFENKSEFIETPFFKDMVKQNPEYQEYADMLTAGGAKVRMSEDFRLQTDTKLRQLSQDEASIAKYGKLAWFGLGKGLHTSSAFIMNEMVPRIKLASAARDYYIGTRRFADQIAAGTMTKESIARSAWDRAENFFGEKDFVRMFWNNTLKSLMQLNYRSVTWREGNLELLSRGAQGQLAAFSQMTKDVADIFNARNAGPAKRLKAIPKALPEIDPNLTHAFGNLAVTIGAGYLFNSVFGHPVNKLWDLLRPQLGGKDSRGLPVRGSFPTYGSHDYPDIWANLNQSSLPMWQRGFPTGLADYVGGGAATIITRLKEVAKNQDWKGDMIYNPHDPFPMQAWSQAWHLFQPTSINLASFERLAEASGSGTTSTWQHLKNLAHGDPAESKAAALSLAGFNIAPKRADLSVAAQEALDAEIRGLPQGPKSSKEAQLLDTQRMLHTLIANKSDKLQPFIKEAAKQGLLTYQEVNRAVLAQAKLTWFQRTVNHLRGPRTTDDLFAVMDKATPAEKAEVFQIVAKKTINDLPKLTGEERNIAISKLKGYQKEVQQFMSKNPHTPQIDDNTLNKVVEPDAKEFLDAHSST